MHEPGHVDLSSDLLAVTDAKRETGGHAQGRGPALGLARSAGRRLDPVATRPSPGPALSLASAAALTRTETTLEREEDLALIRAVARGDRAAFEVLYYRHAPRLGRYAMRLLKQREAVDEVINDVMLAMWQTAGRYDPEVARLSTWLFGITHHQAMKRLSRSSARGEPLSLDDGADGGADEETAPDPEQAAIARELGTAVADGLALLSADHRSVLELAFSEDRSYREIAAVTGSPVNTVKTRMFHARKRLARFLRGRGALRGRIAR